jgi:uncharacterized protein YwqG
MKNHPLEPFHFCPKCGSDDFVVHNELSKHCNNCGFTYYQNPRASTAAFIMNSKGELLIARRAKDPAMGTLDLPGGFVDNDENAEEGMVRDMGFRLLGKPYEEEVDDSFDKEWVQLLQLDTEENGYFDLRFYDMGLLYVMIERDRLLRRDFSHLRAFMTSL